MLFTGIALHLRAQNNTVTKCDGSLGDPVINEDFGSGQNPGAPLPASVTNMQYTTSSCPADGQYTICNSLTANCFGGTWHNVPQDHTGNPNGYMMIINASYQPSVFFTQSAPTLCPGTTYLFSAYILNLMKKSGSNVSQPNITFKVLASDGTVLDTLNTNAIEPTASPTWVQESLYFTTPNTVTSVTVELINNAPGGYGNDLILDDITFRACGPVIQSGFGSTSGAKTMNLCSGDNAEYTFKASVGAGGTGSNSTGYQWQNYTTSGWQDVTGQTSDTYNVQFTNAVAGTYQYRVGIANGLSTAPSCRVYSTPLTVNVYPSPVITGVAATQTVCAGDSIVLSASGGTSYQWSGPGLAKTSQNPVTIKNATIANTGQYTVVAYNQYDCPSTASTMVTVNPLPVASVAGGTTICAGDKTQISASGGVAYSWSPGKTLSDSTIANPIASPLDTTTYKVTISNQYGCSVTDNVTVNVERKAIANAGTNKVIFEGQSIRLNGSEKYGSSYYWTPDSALSDPNSLTPLASPTNNTTYTLHVRSANNCGDDTSSVFVRVYKKIVIPNTFSPNGDGINDNWEIEALVTYPDCLLQVFDRYGQQVYKSIGYNKPWDGKCNGKVLPTGTYYYVLDLKNSTPKMSGWLLIMR
ncbi:MAG: gliding motility-associated C-terminal domain-containing protein [Mucilaginibacter sp.]